MTLNDVGVKRARSTWSRIVGGIRRELQVLLEMLAPKNPRMWAFLLEHGVAWGGNYRAIADEAMRHGIEKIVIVCEGARRKQLESRYQDNKKITVTGRLSWHYARCMALFVSHFPLPPVLRWPQRISGKHVVLVWHGIGFKRIGNRSLLRKSAIDRRRQRRYASRLSGVVASSGQNKERMLKVLDVHESVVWNTGYPRTDYLCAPEDRLPEFLRRDIASIRDLLNGRPLVLYAPTWEPMKLDTPAWKRIRNSVIGPEQLCRLLKVRFPDCAIALRIHPIAAGVVGDIRSVINLSPPEWRHIEAILRLTDVLVTDYSSIWVDYLLVGIGIVGYAPHLDEYREARGLEAGYERLFPGELCKDPDRLMACVEMALKAGASTGSAQPERMKTRADLIERYHRQPPGEAAKRVVTEVKKRVGLK